MAKEIQGIHYRTGEAIAVTIADQKIHALKSITEKHAQSFPYLAPGLVDLQINGFSGVDFNTIPIDPDDIERVTKLLWQEGVTSYFPTVITNSDEAIMEAVRSIADACESNHAIAETIAGIHLEGPFISPEDGPRGAHGKSYVKAPDWELFQRWQKAADGKIKILTLSPEWPGSTEFIAKCVASGVIVSIGHTAATPEQIKAAVEAGATMSTHLGNGAHLMLPRHPNYLWEQLAQDEIWACLIADGFHLPESFLKVAFRAKGRKAMLVSDAVYLSGLEPGAYETHIGGEVVLTPEGKLHLKENEKLLAGSVQMLKEGIAHLVNSELCELKEAWEMASIRPATFASLPTSAGLKERAPADLVVFVMEDNKVNIRETYKAGGKVYSDR